MGIILIIILILLLLLSYILSRQSILSPWFISSAIFLISSTFAVANSNNWGETVNPKTILIIVIGLTAFGLGEVLVNAILIRKNKKEKNIKTIKISKFKISLFTVVGILVVILTYRRFIEIASIGGYPGSGYMVNYARIAIIHYNASWGTFLPIMQSFVTGVGYVFTFIIINNIIIDTKLIRGLKRNIKYFFPVIPSILILIMSTGRSGFINYISIIVFMSIIIWQIKYNWRASISWKIIMTIIISIVVFYFAFIKLGELTGKNEVYGIQDTISLYTGGSIISLGKYLNNPSYATDIFGEETLYGIRYIFRFLGFDVTNTTRHLEFVSFNNGFNTNVFTALRRYIHDYGYVGMFVIQFQLGVFYNVLLSILKVRNSSDIGVILYAYIGYSLIIQSIDDAFLTSFLSITQIFSMIFIFVCYKVIVDNKLKQ